MGALVGAGVNTLRKSETFNSYMFGSLTGKKDKNGKEIRANDGLFSQETQKVFEKYAPDAKKFGTIGGIAGLITPFGPLGGALIGIGASVLKNNATVNRILFGDNGGLLNKDRKKAIKKAFPHIATGVISTIFMGPLGLLGNAALGAGLGMLSTTEMFKKLMLGPKDKDGIRRGGIAGAIRRQIVDPFKETMQEVRKELGKWFKERIFNPVAEGLKPIGRVALSVTKHGMDWMFKTVGNFLKGRAAGWLPKSLTNLVSKGLGAVRGAGGLGKFLVKKLGGGAAEWAANKVKDIGQGLEEDLVSEKGTVNSILDKVGLSGILPEGIRKGFVKGYDANTLVGLYNRVEEKGGKVKDKDLATAVRGVAGLDDTQVEALSQTLKQLKAFSGKDSEVAMEIGRLKNAEIDNMSSQLEKYATESKYGSRTKRAISKWAREFGTEDMFKKMLDLEDPDRKAKLDKLLNDRDIPPEARDYIANQFLGTFEKFKDLDSKEELGKDAGTTSTLNTVREILNLKDIDNEKLQDLINNGGLADIVGNEAATRNERIWEANREKEDSEKELTPAEKLQQEGNEALDENTKTLMALTTELKKWRAYLTEKKDENGNPLVTENDLNDEQKLAAEDIKAHQKFQQVFVDDAKNTIKNIKAKGVTEYDEKDLLDILDALRWKHNSSLLAGLPENLAYNAGVLATAGGRLARNTGEFVGDTIYTVGNKIHSGIRGVESGALAVANRFGGYDSDNYNDAKALGQVDNYRYANTAYWNPLSQYNTGAHNVLNVIPGMNFVTDNLLGFDNNDFMKRYKSSFDEAAATIKQNRAANTRTGRDALTEQEKTEKLLHDPNIFKSYSIEDISKAAGSMTEENLAKLLLMAPKDKREEILAIVNKQMQIRHDDGRPSSVVAKAIDGITKSEEEQTPQATPTTTTDTSTTSTTQPVAVPGAAFGGVLKAVGGAISSGAQGIINIKNKLGLLTSKAQEIGEQILEAPESLKKSLSEELIKAAEDLSPEQLLEYYRSADPEIQRILYDLVVDKFGVEVAESSASSKGVFGFVKDKLTSYIGKKAKNVRDSILSPYYNAKNQIKSTINNIKEFGRNAKEDILAVKNAFSSKDIVVGHAAGTDNINSSFSFLDKIPGLKKEDKETDSETERLLKTIDEDDDTDKKKQQIKGYALGTRPEIVVEDVLTPEERDKMFQGTLFQGHEQQKPLDFGRLITQYLIEEERKRQESIVEVKLAPESAGFLAKIIGNIIVDSQNSKEINIDKFEDKSKNDEDNTTEEVKEKVNEITEAAKDQIKQIDIENESKDKDVNENTKEVTTADGQIIEYTKSGQDGSWTPLNNKDNNSVLDTIKQKELIQEEQRDYLKEIANKIGGGLFKSDKKEEEGGFLSWLLGLLKGPLGFVGSILKFILGGKLFSKLIGFKDGIVSVFTKLKNLPSTIGKLLEKIGVTVTKVVGKTASVLGTVLGGVAMFANKTMGLFKGVGELLTKFITKNKVVALLGAGAAALGLSPIGPFGDDEEESNKNKTSSGRPDEDVNRVLGLPAGGGTSNNQETNDDKEEKGSGFMGLAAGAGLAHIASKPFQGGPGILRHGATGVGFTLGENLYKYITTGEAPEAGELAQDLAFNTAISWGGEKIWNKLTGGPTATEEAAKTETQPKKKLTRAERKAARRAAREAKRAEREAAKRAAEAEKEAAKGNRLTRMAESLKNSYREGRLAAGAKLEETIAKSKGLAETVTTQAKNLAENPKIAAIATGIKDAIMKVAKFIARWVPGKFAKPFATAITKLIEFVTRADVIKKALPKIAAAAGGAILGPALFAVQGFFAIKAGMEGYSDEAAARAWSTTEDKVTTIMKVISALGHAAITCIPFVGLIVPPTELLHFLTSIGRELFHIGSDTSVEPEDAGILSAVASSSVIKGLANAAGYLPPVQAIKGLGSVVGNAVQAFFTDEDEVYAKSEGPGFIDENGRYTEAAEEADKAYFGQYPYLVVESTKYAIKQVKQALTQQLSADILSQLDVLCKALSQEACNRGNLTKAIEEFKKSGQTFSMDTVKIDVPDADIVEAYMAGYANVDELSVLDSTDDMKKFNGILEAVKRTAVFLSHFLTEDQIKYVVEGSIGKIFGIEHGFVDRFLHDQKNSISNWWNTHKFDYYTEEISNAFTSAKDAIGDAVTAVGDTAKSGLKWASSLFTSFDGNKDNRTDFMKRADASSKTYMGGVSLVKEAVPKIFEAIIQALSSKLPQNVVEGLKAFQVKLIAEACDRGRIMKWYLKLKDAKDGVYPPLEKLLPPISEEQILDAYQKGMDDVGSISKYSKDDENLENRKIFVGLLRAIYASAGFINSILKDTEIQYIAKETIGKALGLSNGIIDELKWLGEKVDNSILGTTLVTAGYAWETAKDLGKSLKYNVSSFFDSAVGRAGFFSKLGHEGDINRLKQTRAAAVTSGDYSILVKETVKVVIRGIRNVDDPAMDRNLIAGMKPYEYELVDLLDKKSPKINDIAKNLGSNKEESAKIIYECADKTPTEYTEIFIRNARNDNITENLFGIEPTQQSGKLRSLAGVIGSTIECIPFLTDIIPLKDIIRVAVEFIGPELGLTQSQINELKKATPQDIETLKQKQKFNQTVSDTEKTAKANTPTPTSNNAKPLTQEQKTKVETIKNILKNSMSQISNALKKFFDKDIINYLEKNYGIELAQFICNNTGKLQKIDLDGYIQQAMKEKPDPNLVIQKFADGSILTKDMIKIPADRATKADQDFCGIISAILKSSSIWSKLISRDELIKFSISNLGKVLGVQTAEINRIANESSSKSKDNATTAEANKSSYVKPETMVNRTMAPGTFADTRYGSTIPQYSSAGVNNYGLLPNTQNSTVVVVPPTSSSDEGQSFWGSVKSLIFGGGSKYLFGQAKKEKEDLFEEVNKNLDLDDKKELKRVTKGTSLKSLFGQAKENDELSKSMLESASALQKDGRALINDLKELNKATADAESIEEKEAKYGEGAVEMRTQEMALKKNGPVKGFSQGGLLPSSGFSSIYNTKIDATIPGDTKSRGSEVACGLFAARNIKNSFGMGAYSSDLAAFKAGRVANDGFNGFNKSNVDNLFGSGYNVQRIYSENQMIQGLAAGGKIMAQGHYGYNDLGGNNMHWLAITGNAYGKNKYGMGTVVYQDSDNPTPNLLADSSFLANRSNLMYLVTPAGRSKYGKGKWIQVTHPSQRLNYLGQSKYGTGELFAPQFTPTEQMLNVVSETRAPGTRIDLLFKGEPAANITDEKVKYVWYKLTQELGLSPEQAAGLMGNISHERPSFFSNTLELDVRNEEEIDGKPLFYSTKSANDGLPHCDPKYDNNYGLFCYTEIPGYVDNVTRLANWADSHGKNSSTISTQLEFALADDGYGTDSLVGLKNSTTPEDAAIAFMNDFEHPIAPDPTRADDARRFYDYYKNKPITKMKDPSENLVYLPDQAAVRRHAITVADKKKTTPQQPYSTLSDAAAASTSRQFSEYGQSKYGTYKEVNEDNMAPQSLDDDRYKFTWAWLTDPNKGGMTKEQAAGIMGNMSIERPSFVPNIYESNVPDPRFYLMDNIQEIYDNFNPLDGKDNNYGNFCYTACGDFDNIRLLADWSAKHNKTGSSLTNQLEYAFADDGYDGGHGANATKGTTTIEDATYAFMTEFEKPAGDGAIRDRIAKAQEFYEYFKDKDLKDVKDPTGNGIASSSSPNTETITDTRISSELLEKVIEDDNKQKTNIISSSKGYAGLKGTNFTKSYRDLGPLGEPEYITIHNTGYLNNDPMTEEEANKIDPSANEINTGHLNNASLKNSGIAYHFVVRRSGDIEEGRDETRLGSHTEGHNPNNLGVLVGGHFNYGKPTDQQLASTSQLIRDLTYKYNIPVDRKHIKGHSEWYTDNRTDDPGTNLQDKLDSIVDKARSLQPTIKKEISYGQNKYSTSALRQTLTAGSTDLYSDELTHAQKTNLIIKQTNQEQQSQFLIKAEAKRKEEDIKKELELKAQELKDKLKTEEDIEQELEKEDSPLKKIKNLITTIEDNPIIKKAKVLKDAGMKVATTVANAATEAKNWASEKVEGLKNTVSSIFGWSKYGLGTEDYRTTRAEDPSTKIQSIVDSTGNRIEQVVPYDSAAIQGMPIFKQNDIDWGLTPYKNYYQEDIGKTIQSSACGPTSVAMLATWATGKIHWPADVADWVSKHNGYNGDGTSDDVLESYAAAHGFELRDLGPDYSEKSYAQADKDLSEGSPIMALYHYPSKFTKSDHYITYAGKRSDGTWIAHDPNLIQPTDHNTKKDVTEGYTGFWLVRDKYGNKIKKTKPTVAPFSTNTNSPKYDWKTIAAQSRDYNSLIGGLSKYGIGHDDTVNETRESKNGTNKWIQLTNPMQRLSYLGLSKYGMATDEEDKEEDNKDEDTTNENPEENEDEDTRTTTGTPHTGYPNPQSISTESDNFKLDPEAIRGLPWFAQWDKRWNEISTVEGGKIESSGCSPTSMAMVATWATGKEHKPTEAVENGVSQDHQTYNTWAQKLGFKMKPVDENKVWDELKTKPVISPQGPGFSTDNGHVIVLAGIRSDGSIIVHDPSGSDREDDAGTYRIKAADRIPTSKISKEQILKGSDPANHRGDEFWVPDGIEGISGSGSGDNNTNGNGGSSGGGPSIFDIISNVLNSLINFTADGSDNNSGTDSDDTSTNNNNTTGTETGDGKGLANIIEKKYAGIKVRQHLGDPKKITFHHLGAEEDVEADPDNIHQDHLSGTNASKIDSGLGYHFIINKNGDLVRGRPENQWGAHTGRVKEDEDRNKHNLGILMNGTYQQEVGAQPTEKQLETAAQLLADLNFKYEYIDLDRNKIKGHYEWDSGDTSAELGCPGKGVQDKLDSIVERAKKLKPTITKKAKKCNDKQNENNNNLDEDLGNGTGELPKELQDGDGGSKYGYIPKLGMAKYNAESISNITLAQAANEDKLNQRKFENRIKELTKKAVQEKNELARYGYKESAVGTSLLSTGRLGKAMNDLKKLNQDEFRIKRARKNLRNDLEYQKNLKALKSNEEESKNGMSKYGINKWFDPDNKEVKQRADYIWAKFKELGLSDEGAAAGFGNIMHEGGPDLNPKRVEGGSEANEVTDTNMQGAPGYGLFQFTTTKQDLVDYAKSKNLSTGTLEAQVGGFEYSNTKGSVKERKPDWEAMKTSDSVDNLTYRWVKELERPGVINDGPRKEAAHEVYDYYKGKNQRSYR